MAIKPNQLSPEPLPQTAYVSPPSTGAGKGAFGTKTISGVTEAFYVDSSGNEIQLTNAGAIATPVGSGEANTGVNLSSSGAGKAEVFASKSGVNLQFKRIVAGTNVTLSQDGNEITINSSGGGSGETNTASNLGATGEGVFAAKDGVDLQFKKLIAGTNVTLSSDANSITVNSTGSGGSVDEFNFTLSAGATMADRIAGATGVPAGWTLAPADTAGVGQLGSNPDTLVVTHGETKLTINVTVLELNEEGPTASLGYSGIDLTPQGVVKSTTDLNSNGVIGLQPLTNSARPLVVFVKLI